jgi:hypothetical protein
MRVPIRYASSSAAAAVALLGWSLAMATPSDPPTGSFYSLTGQAISPDYVHYTTSFRAVSNATQFTVALRDAPAALLLDDISVAANGGANVVVNGGFELGAGNDLHQNAPAGWSYSNPLATQGGGVVANYQPHTGSYHYADTAVAHYDMISQTLATTAGQTYDVSFFVAENSGTTTYGSFIDLYLYQAPAAPAVPEPSSWVLMLVGFGAIGGAARRGRGDRRRSAHGPSAA